MGVVYINESPQTNWQTKIKPTRNRRITRNTPAFLVTGTNTHLHPWQKNWVTVDWQVVTLACASRFLRSLKFSWYSLNLLLKLSTVLCIYWKCSTSRLDSLDTKKQSLPWPQSGITQPCLWYTTYIDGSKLEIAVNHKYRNLLRNPDPPYRENTGLNQGRQRKLLMKKRRERRIWA